MSILSLFGFRDPAAKSFTEKVHDKLKRNVDWQHRIEVLENEIKSKDKKIDQQRIELGEQDKKLAEARTAAAELLRQFAPLQESEINLKSSNRLYLLGNDSLRAQVTPLNEEIDRLKAANRVLKDISKRKDDEIVGLRKQVDILCQEESRIKEALMSIANRALAEVEKDESPESVDDSES